MLGTFTVPPHEPSGVVEAVAMTWEPYDRPLPMPIATRTVLPAGIGHLGTTSVMRMATPGLPERGLMLKRPSSGVATVVDVTRAVVVVPGRMVVAVRTVVVGAALVAGVVVGVCCATAACDHTESEHAPPAEAMTTRARWRRRRDVTHADRRAHAPRARGSAAGEDSATRSPTGTATRRWRASSR